MEFSDAFFLDEVRDGFYVPSLMKRNWAAQMEILDDVDRLCREYGLHWYATGGTLIGALRHRGYIPWDDDIDIRMLRADYERFQAQCLPRLPDCYRFISSAEANNYCLTRALANTSQDRMGEEFLEKFHGFPFLAHIDILVMDPLLRDDREEQQRCGLAASLQLMISSLEAKEKEAKKESGAGEDDALPLQTDQAELREATDEELQELERELRLTFGKRIDPKKPLLEELYSILEELSRDGLAHFNAKNRFSNKYVAAYAWYSAAGDKQKYRASNFYGVKYLPFENSEISAPWEYDDFLTVQYGDYMKPVRGAAGHGYPCYAGSEEQILEKIGGREKWLFEYSFSPEDLCVPGPEARDLPETLAENLGALLERLHALLRGALEEGRARTAADALAESQKAAEQLGLLLEATAEGGMPETVALLEQYCDAAYALFALLAGEA